MADFNPFEIRMKNENLPQLLIDTFRKQYEQLASGETGLIAEKEIEGVIALPDADKLPEELAAEGKKALSKAVLVKLNGGLGTGMGLEKAKSLLKVKNGLTFLDIIARHAIASGVPLVLMNSFSTQVDSLEVLSAYSELGKSGLPIDFLQHKAPKILVSDLSPAILPGKPELEWYPPGHGDLYTALVTSGVLDKLLSKGYEYAFVSNADNLGASLDSKILGYFASNRLPFMMECADRTEADKKGGHLAQRKSDGQLVLRESAQCPKADEAEFQNIEKYRYFNTNNLWINLSSLKMLLDKCGGVMALPIIRNSKTIDPRNSASPSVYQLETAMGSAIAVFGGAAAIRVPRSRFAPVKANSDLLAVRSDAYVLTDDYRVVLSPGRKGKAVVIELDAKVYKLIDQMEARFPCGAPSLIGCDKLVVRGDVLFGKNVAIKGNVTIESESGIQRVIPDDSVFT